jgi:hypothetical protein
MNMNKKGNLHAISGPSTVGSDFSTSWSAFAWAVLLAPLMVFPLQLEGT